MQRERFWFGTALVVVPVVFLLLTISPRIEATRSGPVEGHVSIHGRPLSGTFILFVPEDSEATSAIGWIDNTGHYAIGPDWHRKGANGETRFRICLIPKRRRAFRGAAQDPELAEAAEAWVGAGGGAAAVAKIRRLSDPSTSHLEVRLDSAPARVDIAL